MPPRLPRVALLTQGCRANRADTEALAESLRGRCLLVAPGEPADLVVVNTCAVTQDADAAARQALRRAARQHPAARLVAAGCSAELGGEVLGALPGVVAVVGARARETLAGLVRQLLEADAPSRAGDAGLGDGELRPEEPIEVAPGEERAPPAPGLRRSPARPLLKLQDGCDASCAYCAVPAARGPSRSVPFEEAVAALVDRSARHAEVVLTGVHLGAYGQDLTPRRTLQALLEAAAARGLGGRLRLSSIEPLELPLALLDGPVGPALCRHLHLPLQSGSAAVLEAMGRPYRPPDLHRVAEGVLTRWPDACLGADLMSGFPGETEADHQATLALCQALPLAYLHVFPFSPRPGTRAAGLPNAVPPAVARRRAAELRALSDARWGAFLSAQVGRVHQVVVERHAAGLASGTSGHGVPVQWPAGPEPRGTCCAVRVLRSDGRGCHGRLEAAREDACGAPLRGPTPSA